MARSSACLQFAPAILAVLVSISAAGCYKAKPVSGELDFSEVPEQVAFLAVLEGLTVDFGPKPVSSTTILTLHLTNVGPHPATELGPADAAVIAQTPAFGFLDGAFPGTGGTCSNTLAPGETCTLVVAYAPQEDGPQEGTLSLEYVNGVLVFPLPITLKGNTPAVPVISGGPVFDFGYVAKDASGERTLTITNTGATEATQLQASTANPLEPPFAYKGGNYPGAGGTCSDTLPSGESCTVVLTFNPVELGAMSGLLALEFHDGNSFRETARPLAGHTEAVLTIAEAPTLTWAGVPANSSADKTVTVTNAGGEATFLEETGLTPIGTPFSFKDGIFPGAGGTCSPVLAAGESCTLTLTFSPLGAGVFTDTLTLTYWDGGSSRAVALDLSGTAIPE